MEGTITIKITTTNTTKANHSTEVVALGEKNQRQGGGDLGRGHGPLEPKSQVLQEKRESETLTETNL